ncbi:TetR/AcrR family transcriptional regulator [Caballeronia sp. LP006]|uniref:TetR/AcrR family transcriptional regulator n=1 Tax=Caballeronia sp. LP006 TaxID=3038552 RepID=UPI0028587806|nr:TetR/AcrR family transcriptional regulator [Caballeronia sp. LP006]MDR5826279.1 TetR/AcrR family transcriptional regulator [Caballeronia sp. LP006]
MEAVRYEDMPQRQVAILDAAAEAFSQLGYEATSIDYVADQIKATKGSVYYYYRSKTDLFAAVHRRAMEMNLEIISPIANDHEAKADERLRLMAMEHTHLMMEYTSYQRVTVQGVELHITGSTTAAQRAELTRIIDMRDEYESLFRLVIEEGISQGVFKPANAKLIVKPLLGALNWTTLWYRPRPKETEEDRTKMAEEIANYLVDGLRLTAANAARK